MNEGWQAISGEYGKGSGIPNHPTLVERYQALLDITEAITRHQDLNALFAELSERLRKIIEFDYSTVMLHEEETNRMRLHLIGAPTGSEIETTFQPGWNVPIEESASGLVWQTQEPLIVHRLADETRFPVVADLLRENGIRSFYMFPLTASGRQMGAFDIGSLRESAFTEDELAFLAQVARQIAIAVDNAHNFEDSRRTGKRLEEEKERLRLLLAVNNAVVTNLNLNDLLDTVSNELRRVMPHDYASLTLYDEPTGKLRLHALDFDDNQQFIKQGTLIELENSPAGTVFTSGEPLIIRRPEPERFKAEFSAQLIAAGLRSGCSVPLRSHNQALGVLSVAARRDEAFDEKHCELLTQIARQVAIAVENALAFGEIETLKNKLAQEKLYLEEEIKTEFNFSEIVGHSRTLRHALKEVEQVAPTDAIVLITGETGTGKELVARAIHNISSRRERTMVKLNCAAIPTGLLESELFGHEKGAFTGAVASRVGRFELANKGTLFLDEVGDIPLELQAKLLRVLQEGEFERLGSSRTIKVDVRVVAATHRDLQQRVAENAFRADLFYRLNVFPIHLPPLKERREDIPLLVNYFVAKHARRMNKRITMIPTRAMQALIDYHWAGNIRELENFLERAVILTNSDELHFSLDELRRGFEPQDINTGKSTASLELVTLEEMERRYIAEVLAKTQGVIGGKGGAAEILDLPVSTLRSRMKKLGMI